MVRKFDYGGLTGIVIKPGDPAYDQARQVYNRAIQRFPLAINYCLKVRDVANAVRWARRNRVGFRIRAGGHNYEGYSVGDGVLVIDLSRMNAVTLDNESRTVTALGGALNRDLAAALSGTDYAFPAGSCPKVGVGGYAMGGGWNFFCRFLGFGCDSLKEVKLVNYMGELLTANESENPDLFWALRGGGDNNFGVAAALTFKIPRKTERVTYFTIYRPDADAAVQEAFLTAWQQWLPGLDRRMTLRPSVYNAAGEGRAIYSRGVFFGRPEEAVELLQPLIRSAHMTVEAQYVTFSRALQILGSVYPPSEMFKTTGRFVHRALDPHSIRRIVDTLDERPEGVEFIEYGLFAMGGKVSQMPPDATAFFYRNAQYILTPQAVWTNPRSAPSGRKWVERAFTLIKPLTAGSFVNFPYAELKDYEKAYYGGNVPRLRKVKKEYDPENVFRYPQSIRP